MGQYGTFEACQNYNRSKCSESFLIAVTFKGKVVKNGKLEDPGIGDPG